MKTFIISILLSIASLYCSCQTIDLNGQLYSPIQEVSIADRVLKDVLEKRRGSEEIKTMSDLQVKGIVDDAVAFTQKYLWKDILRPFLGNLLNPECKRQEEQDRLLGKHIRQKFTDEAISEKLGIDLNNLR